MPRKNHSVHRERKNKPHLIVLTLFDNGWQVQPNVCEHVHRWCNVLKKNACVHAKKPNKKKNSNRCMKYSQSADCNFVNLYKIQMLHVIKPSNKMAVFASFRRIHKQIDDCGSNREKNHNVGQRHIVAGETSCTLHNIIQIFKTFVGHISYKGVENNK